MSSQRWVGVLLWLVLVVCRCYAAKTPKFVNVAAERGFLNMRELDQRLPRDNKYRGVTVADFDRDGNYDILASDHGNKPELYFSTGRKSFQFHDIGLGNRDLHSTVAEDIDNDGYLDFIFNLGGSNGNAVKGKPIVFKTVRNCSTRKLDNDRLGLNEIAFRGRSMSFLDMNGDGFSDLLLVNKRNNSATYSHAIYRNNGNGTFKLLNDTGIEQVLAFFHHVIDANGDSYPDILFMGFERLELWMGTGTFKFEDGTSRLGYLRNRKFNRCAVEFDYDGDGDMDLLIARGETRRTVPDMLLENLGTKYREVPGSVLARDLKQHSHITSGDFNNDGHVDLFVSRKNGLWAPISDQIYLNEGDGTFSLAGDTGTKLVTPNTEGDNAIAFDFDADGKVDILSGWLNTSWRLYRNTENYSNAHYIHVRIGVPRAETAEPYWFRRRSLGALVKVSCNGKVFLQRVGSPGQSHSQAYLDTLHFGLGSCRTVNSIEVRYWHNVVVTRTGPIAADQMITVGRYFPCSNGKLGRWCNEAMRPCTRSPCASGQACEIAKLVGTTCDSERCTEREEEEPEEAVIRNGSFETDDAWVLIGSASYSAKYAYEGRRHMRFDSSAGEVRTMVNLQGGETYRLQCYFVAANGVVDYRIFYAANLVAENTDRKQTLVAGSTWKAKFIDFKANWDGNYKISLGTKEGVSASIDSCSITRVAAGIDSMVNVLKNGDFEKDTAWELLGNAKYFSTWSFSGNQSMRLRLYGSEVVQSVDLRAKRAYALSCAVRGEYPVEYRVFQGRRKLAENTSLAGKTLDGVWKMKYWLFFVHTSDSYRISLRTLYSETSTVDWCKLRTTRIASVARRRSGRSAVEGEVGLREELGYSESSHGLTCRETCLKLFCPV